MMLYKAGEVGGMPGAVKLRSSAYRVVKHKQYSLNAGHNIDIDPSAVHCCVMSCVCR